MFALKQLLGMAEPVLPEAPAQPAQAMEAHRQIRQDGFAQGFTRCVEGHGQNLATMGESHRLGLAESTQGIQAASQALGNSMENFGQNFNYCAAAHGQSMESMGQNHHLGLAAHGQEVARAGQSFGHGMSSAGQDLNHGITALGHGFADLGRYISKSITFLTFALIVRSVVDIGFEYILGMVGMTTLLLLSMWNLQLQASLAQHRRGQRQVQEEIQRTQDAHECAGTLRGELAASQSADSANEAEKGLLQAELAQAQRKQAQTDQELEEARMLLLKMSNEVTQMRSTHGGSFQGPTSLMFSNAEKVVELDEAHKEIAKMHDELAEATLTIAFLGGSTSSSAADGCKRRRSV